MAKTNGWVKVHRKILEEDLTASQFKFLVGSTLLARSPKSKDSGLVDLSIRDLSKALKMSRSEVGRRRKELENMGIITIVDKGFILNNYAVEQSKQGVPPAGQLPLIGVPPAGRSVPSAGRSVPSRETTEGHKTVKTVKNNKKKSPAKKKRYFFDNILLTEDEYQKLVERFGEDDTKDRLEALSLYKQSKGKKYASDYATVLAWERRDERIKGGQSGQTGRRTQTRRLPRPQDYRSPEQIYGDEDG